ncbi:MAG TPA: hypothetical protein DCG70_08830 [Lachnoclostridium sp.]|jgi:hypothetical protein|nr:hypothetical protein [Lachnoclostridium sp.]
MKIVDGTNNLAKLETLFSQLEEKKHALADIVDVMEEDGTSGRAVDMLIDSLESIDSALDSLQDAMDEMA